MGIKETHTSPGGEVLEDEVPEKGALPQAGLPDHVEMARPVLGREKHEPGVVRPPEGAGSDAERRVAHGERVRPSPLPLPIGEPGAHPEEEPQGPVCLAVPRSRPHDGRVVTPSGRGKRVGRGLKSRAGREIRKGGAPRRPACQLARYLAPALRGTSPPAAVGRPSFEAGVPDSRGLVEGPPDRARPRTR